MNWWRWNHEIVRWQSDDDFTSSASHDLNDVSFDTSRTRHVQWTCSRFIWWRFSRGMAWEVHDLALFASYLGCIFITYNVNKFIERVSFWTYRYICILFPEDKWSQRYHQLVTSVSSSLLSHRRYFIPTNGIIFFYKKIYKSCTPRKWVIFLETFSCRSLFKNL